MTIKRPNRSENKNDGKCVKFNRNIQSFKFNPAGIPLMSKRGMSELIPYQRKTQNVVPILKINEGSYKELDKIISKLYLTLRIIEPEGVLLPENKLKLLETQIHNNFNFEEQRTMSQIEHYQKLIIEYQKKIRKLSNEKEKLLDLYQLEKRKNLFSLELLRIKSKNSKQ